MTTNNKTLIHLGGPKTASTTMQRAVFGNLPEVFHFGEYGDGVTSQQDESIFRSLWELDDQFFNSSVVEHLIDTHLNSAGSRRPIFSSADVFLSNRPKLAAERFRHFFGTDIDILLVVRHQADALVSFYSGHGAWLKPAPRPYFRAFVPFTSWFDFQSLLLPDSKLFTFSYWDQLCPFIDIFGINRIHIVLFEELVNGSGNSWTTFANLIGENAVVLQTHFNSERARERPYRRQALAGQLLSYVLPIIDMPDIRNFDGLPGRFLKRGRPFTPLLSKSQRSAIDDYYSQGNLLLSRNFNLDISKWGYPGSSHFE